MPNIAIALKQEIARLARRELKSSVNSIKKASATYRSEIAALKRRLQTLERQVKNVSQTSRRAPPSEMPGDEGHHRWRAAGFAQHRKRLGLSAAECGKLLGVGALSVYKWESGQVRPRDKYLPAIASVRAMGKREAAARLAKLE